MIAKVTLKPLPPDHACSYAHWQYTHYTETPTLHTHDHHELFWIEEGSGLETINGDTRPLTPGLLVLVRADDIHGFSATRDEGLVRFVNFAFPRRLWNELWRRRLERRAIYFDEKDHLKRAWQLEPADLERLRTLARDLAAGARDPLSTEAFLVGVVALLASMERRHAAGHLPAWLAHALALMREPRHFALGTPEFARVANRTPEHLARAVRKHLGCTPTDVVNEARLAHAAGQLRTTERPIPEIVADCGLGNIGHFYKLFRAHHGTSPERYRSHAYTPAPRTYTKNNSAKLTSRT